MRIPPLKAIVAFESVARTKSVNRAADELGLTPSAVSHQLANLEAMVGRPLFARLGRGLVLTATGQQYLTDVTGSLADLSRATERASSESSVEILRIHSSPSFGLMWLLPRLASFHEANGNIQLNLDCSFEDVSFTSGYYDLDIRHGYAHWCCCPLIPLAVSIDDASGKIAVKHVQKGIEAKSPRWTMLRFGNGQAARCSLILLARWPRPSIPLMRHFHIFQIIQSYP